MRRVSRSFHVCTRGFVVASGIAPAIVARHEQQPQSTRQIGRCVADEFSSASIENARVSTAELVAAGAFTPGLLRRARIIAPVLPRSGARVRVDRLADQFRGLYKGNGNTDNAENFVLPVRHESVT